MQHALVPKLRFREYQDTGSWTAKTLDELADPIIKRVGDSDCVPFTVTTGEGLVSQEEKYGRIIAGKSLSNYYRLQRDDFAFNKSATKMFPQGYIARLQRDERAAVPNSIFTCFRVVDENVDTSFLDYMFQGNLHGRWLRHYITVGARAHGALNISDDDLYAMPVPLPEGDQSLNEQKKIADCLGSLDALIASEGRKLAALRDHKQGLMQQLFPREGEIQPRLRFPEFQDAGEWEWKTLAAISDISSGSTPLRSNAVFYTDGNIPWVKTGDLNNSFITQTEESITPKAKARINPADSVLVAMYGGFNQIGRTGYLKVPAATNQAISVLVVDRQTVLPIYLLSWLNAKVEDWKRIASSSRKDPNITGSDVARFPISFPATEEQQRIAACLSSLDTLIAAQSDKIETLKTQKHGLMQQLFPSPEDAKV